MESISQEEMWAFKDELVTAIAALYAKDPRLAHHDKDQLRSYAAELVGDCHRRAVEKITTRPTIYDAGQ